MTKEYDNTNRGAIWANKDKEGAKDPDFKGSLNVDGREFWVAAWKRKSDASPKSPALSFSIKPKDDKATYSKADTVKRQTVAQEMDDEIPF